MMNCCNYFNIFSFPFYLAFQFAAADQSRVMQDQMTMQAGGMPQDPKQAFKAEWEALEVTEHNWALRNAEVEMTALVPSPE